MGAELEGRERGLQTLIGTEAIGYSDVKFPSRLSIGRNG
jgi:hypothetical protein